MQVLSCAVHITLLLASCLLSAGKPMLPLNQVHSQSKRQWSLHHATIGNGMLTPYLVPPCVKVVALLCFIVSPKVRKVGRPPAHGSKHQQVGNHVSSCVLCRVGWSIWEAA